MRIRTTLVGVTAAMLLLAPAAGAQEVGDEPLAGYVGMASGAAFSIQPIFPGLLPTGDAPFEVTGALSAASVKSGGNAFGQAVLAFPGSAASNLGPLLGTAAGEPLFSEAVPPFPASVSASQNEGGKTQGAEPGPYLEALAKPGSASGRAQSGEGGAPGVLGVDSVTSVSRSLIEGGQLVTETVVTLQGVSIGPAVTIESIKSTARATSDGNKATSEGDTVVTGAKVAGQPADVTKDGIKATGPLAGPANAALKASGAEVKIAESSGSAEGGSADRVSPGVIATLPNPAAAASPQFVGSKFVIALAPTAVGALASPPFDNDFVDALPEDTSFPDVASGGGGGFSEFSDTVEGLFGDNTGSFAAGGSSSGAGSAVAAGVPLDTEETSGVIESVAGIPLSVLAGLFFVIWLGSRWLRRYVGRFVSMEG